MIERIRPSAFWIIAVLVGSFTWVIDAAWGWHARGWMVEILGYHDAYASGVIHGIAGGAALGVLVVLGPRVGKFDKDGNPRDIVPHNPWLVCVGLFMIYTGFWGFYAACNVPIIDLAGIEGLFGDTEGRGQMHRRDVDSNERSTCRRHRSGAITFNFLMSLSGGLLAGLRGVEGRRVLDLLRRPRRHHHGLGRQRPLPPHPGHVHRHVLASRLRLQAALLGGTEASRSTTPSARWRYTATRASSAW